ncbi:DNA topoisomerase I [Butyricicoccus pullicaecorum]|uniref:DNA topoisomerase 1 n=1 Tax=Butyricicoccus pullicaecorum TaxID=501571 RepID=A0A1Y4LCH8_9FIRM|nr:type I DNA topoisomerase [Butyricicoccus pullicaecorum]OUP54428.1 DNA topoisomerase I [Butyricicoccus pullicaecorum]
MSKLVIVESPAKAKTIGKYLGSDYVVKASMGHLRDLPRKTMGVDLEHDFEPEYGPIEGKDKIISELRKAAKEADFVYLATDPDREGEAISWHLKSLLNLKDGEYKRVTFNEITKKGVHYGIEHPRDIDVDLVDAQQARRILDRIVGYRLSPFLWRKVKRGLSAGRVQSVATRLVVDREQEIRAFQPEEYWSIEAVLRTQAGGTFTARYYGEPDGKVELKNEEQTRKIVDEVTGKPFLVSTIKKGKKKKSAAPPFTTSTLQQEASRKLNMVPRRTMSVAQELYEGVELGGEYGLTGLITYMRTDSLRLSDEATAAAAAYIQKRYGEQFYPGKPRVFKTKGAAQDAHEAIRPSNVEIEPEAVRDQLTPDQYKLYKLIWSRFVACQMADAILDTISADITSEGHIFRASGHTVAFPGFTAVYEESTDDDKQSEKGEKSESGKPLPAFDEGDSLTADKIDPAQHFTQPPARYTEASLIRAMEEKGIGRPSTYAPTIATIIDRDYVSKENRSLRPTPLGEGVTGLLVDKFKSVADYEFTANMENQLDEVEAGKVAYVQLLHTFYDGFAGALEQAEKDLDKTRIKIPDEETDVVCEKCGRKMVIKSGRFGKFLACPGFPECTNTKPMSEDTGASCPTCGAKVVKKKSARGYVYYSCETYPTCQFITWDKPLKTKCPVCDSSLFRHTDRDSKEVTDVCLREGCTYKELVKEGVSPEEAEKNRQRREARAAKAAERAAAKEAEEAEKKTKKTTRKTKKAEDAEGEEPKKKATRKTTKKAAAEGEEPKKKTTRKTTKKAETAEGEEPKKTTRKTTKKAETAEGEEPKKTTRRTTKKAAAEGEEPQKKTTRKTTKKAETEEV